MKLFSILGLQICKKMVSSLTCRCGIGALIGSSSWSTPGAKPGATPGPTGAGSPSPKQGLVLLFLLITFATFAMLRVSLKKQIFFWLYFNKLAGF